MKLPKPSEHKDFEPCPAGNHLAVCFELVDLGTQENWFEGKQKIRPEIQIGWEIPGERMEDGRPFMIGQRYTFSMHEKAKLRHHLESWRGRPFTELEFETFDLRNILGKSCMLQIIHNQKGDKTYANLASIAALPKGLSPATETENPMLYFSFEEPTEKEFLALPDWMKEVISKSPQYQAWCSGGESQEVADDYNQDVDYTSDPF